MTTAATTAARSAEGFVELLEKVGICLLLGGAPCGVVEGVEHSRLAKWPTLDQLQSGCVVAPHDGHPFQALARVLGQLELKDVLMEEALQLLIGHAANPAANARHALALQDDMFHELEKNAFNLSREAVEFLLKCLLRKKPELRLGCAQLQLHPIVSHAAAF